MKHIYDWIVSVQSLLGEFGWCILWSRSIYCSYEILPACSRTGPRCSLSCIPSGHHKTGEQVNLHNKTVCFMKYSTLCFFKRMLDGEHHVYLSTMFYFQKNSLQYHWNVLWRLYTKFIQVNFIVVCDAPVQLTLCTKFWLNSIKYLRNYLSFKRMVVSCKIQVFYVVYVINP